MSEGLKKPKGNGERETITVSLKPEIAERLAAFCREMKIAPDLVVERALADYFREGDVSH
ncbi:MAG TPA: hypothetical protein DD658_03505 [Deltaproteobacteria bacterium]|nr:MAG: hypothetical protein A2X88_09635 [Deltaproteobacteria bacterium GWC2_65_14]HBO69245.1 hypothetical protein [Deltaproteobacteria bacterium]